MAKGKKTGGREAGVPNRSTAVLAARLEELGCDPLELSAKIAQGQELDGPHPSIKAFYAFVDDLAKLEDKGGAVTPELVEKLRSLVDDNLTRGYVPIELRSKHIADLMRYVWAPRKAIEVTGADGAPLVPTIDPRKLSTEALREIALAVSPDEGDE